MSNPSSSNPSSDSWSPSVLSALSRRGDARATPVPQPVDVDALRQKGYDTGYAEGLAAGRAEAARLAEEMSALLGAMNAPFRDSDAVLLRELLSLTERVAQAVVRRELEAGVDIEAVLADALAALGSVAVPVQLTLNPADAALCRDLGLMPDGRFTVLEDSDVHRGGLHLRAGNSFVDASVESRIEAALADLREAAGLPEEDVPQVGQHAAAPSDPSTGEG